MRNAPSSDSRGLDHAWLQRTLGPFLVSLTLTLTLVAIPRLPLGTDLDSSWSAVLNYAHQKGLQFGTDLVFTYGPLGFLTTFYFSPYAAIARLVINAVLCFTIVTGVCLAAWRLSSFWRWLLIIVFLYLAANTDARTDLFLVVGLFCWGLLCLVESGARLWGYLGVLAALAVFSALGKITFLFAAGFTVLMVAGGLGLRGKRAAGLGLLVACAAGLLLCWVALGQTLSHLAAFFSNALAISRGYVEAMGTESLAPLRPPVFLMAGFALVIVILRSLTCSGDGEKYSRWRRGVLLAWFSGLLFIVWKHASVREERDHIEVLLGFVPTMALLLEILPSRPSLAQRSARLLGILCCLISAGSLVWLLAGKFKVCASRPFTLAAQHLRTVMQPGEYWRRMRELEEVEHSAMQLPKLREKIGPASVDLFGNDQCYAVFNQLNYRPRPVFQSYAAYTEPLMKLNEQFYLSTRAPGYVLFRLSAIDDRFPPLEDARLLRDLLINYQPVDAEGPFLLLKSRQSVPAGLSLLREGAVRAGELIDLREYGEADLWLEINLEPSLLGRARTILYRPPEVQVAVWCQAASLRVARFRASAPMLNAGFVASPLQLDNMDVLDLYTGNPVTRPLGYSIEPRGGTEGLWRQSIGFRIYRIQNQLGRCAPRELVRLLKFPGFDLAPSEIFPQRSSFIQVGGKAALLLRPGGYMRFVVPKGARIIKGRCGFAPAAYLLAGKTEGADFRIEEELSDGSLRVLHSEVLRPRSNPEDRGMKSFAVACPGEGQRKLILRALPAANGGSPWDLTCWAGIGFR